MIGYLLQVKIAPHPPLRGTFSLMEKGLFHPLSHRERVATGRVRGQGRVFCVPATTWQDSSDYYVSEYFSGDL